MTGPSTFTTYADAVRNFSGEPEAPELLIERQGSLSVFYAPFEWVNTEARLVLVGITPGRVQAINALREASRQLGAGADTDTVLRRAKQAASFSGTMRPNLVAMLDHIGINTWLGVPSTSSLFDGRADLLQSASALQYPVFVDHPRDRNYKGRPGIVDHPLLRAHLVSHFLPMAVSLPEAVFVPLGPVPTKALTWLTGSHRFRPRAVLAGLPHPSGANAERISYFLGRKQRELLSSKTNADKIDASRTALRSLVSTLT